MSTEGIIRPCVPEHCGRYGEIYAAAFSGAPWHDPWKPEDAETHVREILDSRQSYGLEILDSRQSYGLEYVIGGRVAGFILGESMLFHYGRTFEINDLAVDPAYQGKGIAKKLLEQLKADMKARGIAGLHLITSAGGFLPDFYARHGFQQENRVILMGMEL